MIVPRPSDIVMANRAKRAGATNSLRIILEARRMNIPISWLFAIVEQESEFRNVFGNDKGGPFRLQNVTKERVKALIDHVRNGGTSNGVGFTQLTSLAYILRAEELGGAHIPRNQIRAGAEVLREKTGGNMLNAWKYNGNKSYQNEVELRQKHWHRVLTKES